MMQNNTNNYDDEATMKIGMLTSVPMKQQHSILVITGAIPMFAAHKYTNMQSSNMKTLVVLLHSSSIPKSMFHFF